MLWLVLLGFIPNVISIESDVFNLVPWNVLPMKNSFREILWSSYNSSDGDTVEPHHWTSLLGHHQMLYIFDEDITWLIQLLDTTGVIIIQRISAGNLWWRFTGWRYHSWLSTEPKYDCYGYNWDIIRCWTDGDLLVVQWCEVLLLLMRLYTKWKSLH